MRRISCRSVFATLGLMVSGLMGCGGSSLSAQDACNQAMAATCEKANACGGAAALAAMGNFTSVADCTKGLQADTCIPSNLTCDVGETFKPDQAQKCVDGIKSSSCTDFTNNVMPAACDLACSPGGGTGGSGGTGGGGGFGGSGGTGGSAGGPTAQVACNQVMAALCNRTSACAGSAGLTALGYTSIAACTTGMQAESCATPAAAACDSTEVYYPDQAQQCVDGMVALSCANYTAGTFPAACDLVCQ
jgi:hypothetical protein